MPFLVELKTNLKDLKYGKDSREGGSSREPLIVFPIDEGLIQEPFRTLYSKARNSADSTIRGGIANTEGLGTLWGQLDRDRIAKLFKETARGQAFLNKQQGLQLSNPKLQTQESLPSSKLSDLPSLIDNTRIYNKGRNTLTSIQYSGTGIHLNRAGQLPFPVNEKYYSDIVAAEKNLSNEEVLKVNRLLILHQLKMKSSGATATISDVGFSEFVDKLGISLDRNQLFSYEGGPGSLFGVGTTIIKRSVDTSLAAKDGKLPDGRAISSVAMTYDKLMQKSKRQIDQTGIISDYGDFRNDVDGYSGKRIDDWSSTEENKRKRIDQRFFIGRVDKINTLPLFKYNGNEEPWNLTSAKDAENKSIDQINDKSQDIIKFVFECISNDSVDETVAMFFRAHLSSITDNHAAAWNSFKYMGRAENFYTYQGVDRSIQFSFKIAIGSRDELLITYNKLNYLISQAYPDYAFESTQFMRAPLMKLTIGDYFYRLPGFVESINITLDDNGTWEIDDGFQLPHFLSVGVSYKSILNELPQRGRGGKNLSRFIAEPIFRTAEVQKQNNETPPATTPFFLLGTSNATTNTAPQPPVLFGNFTTTG